MLSKKLKNNLLIQKAERRLKAPMIVFIQILISIKQLRTIEVIGMIRKIVKMIMEEERAADHLYLEGNQDQLQSHLHQMLKKQIKEKILKLIKTLRDQKFLKNGQQMKME